MRNRVLCGFASRCGRVRCVHSDVSVHTRGGRRGSALGIAQRGTVDPDGVALMAQPTEEGLDERFVAEKRLPFRVIEVRRNNCGLSAVAFLHQLEEDVGLFGFEIEVPQFVNVQDVDPDQRVEQAARRSIGERGVHLIEEVLRPDEAPTIAVLNRLEQEPGRESRFPPMSALT